MPENETLLYDARSASRWRPIGASMENGLSTNDSFPAIQDAFYGLFQSVWRQWRGRGVDAAELFRAALEDSNLLRELIRQTNFDHTAQLLRDVTRSQENPDMEGLIGAFLDAAWESAQAQLQLDCREDTPSPELSTYAAIPAKYVRHIRAFHQQIAHLRELDTNVAPAGFRRYLLATNAVSSDSQLAPHVEVYRRYRKGWLPLLAEARRLALPWFAQAPTLAHAQGATS